MGVAAITCKVIDAPPRLWDGSHTNLSERMTCVNTIASSSNSSTFDSSDQVLRLGLRLDAGVSGAFGLVLLAGGGLLAGLLGTPATFLWAVGGVCLAYAAVLMLAQARLVISTAIGWTFFIANCVWVVASVLVVGFQWLPFTALGSGFTVLQACVVAGLAYLQWIGLQRAR